MVFVIVWLVCVFWLTGERFVEVGVRAERGETESGESGEAGEAGTDRENGSQTS